MNEELTTAVDALAAILQVEPAKVARVAVVLVDNFGEEYTAHMLASIAGELSAQVSEHDTAAS